MKTEDTEVLGRELNKQDQSLIHLTSERGGELRQDW